MFYDNHKIIILWNWLKNWSCGIIYTEVLAAHIAILATCYTVISWIMIFTYSYNNVTKQSLLALDDLLYCNCMPKLGSVNPSARLYKNIHT